MLGLGWIVGIMTCCIQSTCYSIHVQIQIGSSQFSSEWRAASVSHWWMVADEAGSSSKSQSSPLALYCSDLTQLDRNLWMRRIKNSRSIRFSSHYFWKSYNWNSTLQLKYPQNCTWQSWEQDFSCFLLQTTCMYSRVMGYRYYYY